MATPQSAHSEEAEEETEGGQRTGSFQAFEASPEPGPGPGSQPDHGDDRPKNLYTLLALGGSLLVALGVTFLVDNLSPLDTTQFLIQFLFTSAVIFIGFLPVRWGWWIVPGVTLAFYGLLAYNLTINQSGSIFGSVPLSSPGYAIVATGPGVVVGYVLQGVYHLIVPSEER